jgi:hemerythrin-like domain-containing protein
MTPEEQKEIQEYVKAISKILYRHTDKERLETFESIEMTVREKILTEIAPQIGEFFLTEEKGRRQQVEQGQSKAV